MSFYKVIILVGFVQGAMLCFSLFLKTFKYKHKNTYFLLLIAAITTALLAKLLYSSEYYRANPQLWYYFDLVAYFIGPLWYYTLLKSIKSTFFFTYTDLLYFSSVAVHVIFLIRITLMADIELLQATSEIWFIGSFYAFVLSVIVVNLIFFIRANTIIRKHSDIRFPDLLRKGHSVFTGILLGWLSVFCVSFLIAESAYPLNETAYNTCFLAFAFLTFGLAVLAIVRPASFYFLTQVYDSSETYLLKQIAEKIIHHMNSEEPYLDRSYSLGRLSEDIDVNTTLASKAINRILHKNLTDLLNQHRVNHFLKSIRTNKWPNLTHAAIAEKAGFGNKVSFYKAFKREMGMTPKAYLSQNI